MGRCIFNICTLVSLLIFGLVLFVLVVAEASTSRSSHVLNLSQECHLTVDIHHGDARLEIFNDFNYGPYTGSIIDVTAPGHASHLKSRGFDFPGIFFRHFLWPDGRVLWTFAVSLYYPLAISAALPLIWYIRRSRSRRMRRGFPIDEQRNIV